jgi:hypothetical protein
VRQQSREEVLSAGADDVQHVVVCEGESEPGSWQQMQLVKVQQLEGLQGGRVNGNLQAVTAAGSCSFARAVPC